MAHVAESDLAAFLAGRLEPEAVRRVVRHLVAGCAECRARLRAVVPAGMLMPERRAGSPAGEPYGAAIDRARRDTCRLATRLRKDREQIERALERIREHPEGFNGLTWGERQSVRGWKHVEVCLAVSFDLRHRDPRQMLSFAEAAQEVADRIAPPVYGAAFLLDLRARAWGELANALRVNERFDRAEAALKQARSLVEEGTGDSIIEARLDEIEASLRKDQRQLEKAYRLLDQAHRTWLKIGDRHLAGRVMVIKGLTLIVDGEPLQAARVLRQAVDLLDVGRDPELAAAAHHDLLFALVESGRFGEAGKLLFEGDLRRLFAGDPLNLLRLRGLEAKILVGRGRVADAERVFRDVRAGFLDHGLDYMAAIAGMDLAAVLLRQEKKHEARDLAWEIYAAFRRLAADPQAVLAVQSFELVCRLEEATPPMAERVGRFLDLLQRSPDLRFDPQRMVNG